MSEMEENVGPENEGTHGALEEAATGTNELEILTSTDQTTLILQSDDESEVLDREQVTQAYNQALAERNALLTKSHTIQNKLADYFKRKKTDEQKEQKNTDDSADVEVKYLRLIQSIDEMNDELESLKSSYTVQIEEMNTKKKAKQDQVNADWESLLAKKKEISKSCVDQRSGKPIAPKQVELMEEIERKKELEVCQARLENIRQKNKLKKREMALKQKEELAEGLHLIDFEQLKIENQTYNEKIEERNENLLKFKNKIQSTVQVLTHLKEKLEFVSSQNCDLELKLEEIEKEATSKRDKLAKTKLARDRLRSENIKLQQNMGLLGKMDLLADFETQLDGSESMGTKLSQLKARHAELKKENQSYKSKIEKHRKAKNDLALY